jgi:hypothetical protein
MMMMMMTSTMMSLPCHSLMMHHKELNNHLDVPIGSQNLWTGTRQAPILLVEESGTLGVHVEV